jgi:hypothetical protein
MTMFKETVLLCAAATLMMAGSANATSFTFARITNTNVENLAGQLSVDVTANGAFVDFRFTNAVGTPSSIADIYFDDGTLLGIASITDSGVGVAFTRNATPGDLPGRHLASPPFVTTAGFTADSDPPVAPDGVNLASEWVTITFSLINNMTYADTIAALNDGSLRIGLHVQAIGTAGGSDSYVNTVPDGGMTLMLLGGALVGLGALRRRFRA